MHTRNDRQWIDYCRALNLDYKDNSIKQDQYYLRGFKEWKRLQREFSYYNYMDKNY